MGGPALGLMPIVWVGIGLSVFQQFVGINVIFCYSGVLWRAVGFSESSSLQITAISGAVNILTTLVAIALIDKIGRKPLLLIAAIAASAQWIANWASSTSFPSLKNAGLGIAYGIYAGFALLSFIFVRLAITETNGQELERMPDHIRLTTPKPTRLTSPGPRVREEPAES